MEKLSDLEASLLGMKSGKDAAFPAALALANEMGIADSKPVPPPRGAKKPKGQPGAPRKPYFVYLAADGTEIWCVSDSCSRFHSCDCARCMPYWGSGRWNTDGIKGGGLGVVGVVHDACRV